MLKQRKNSKKLNESPQTQKARDNKILMNIQRAQKNKGRSYVKRTKKKHIGAMLRIIRLQHKH